MGIIEKSNYYLSEKYGPMKTVSERNEIIKQNLYLLRTSSRYKMTEVAEAIGVSSQAYNNYEKHGNMPSFETIVRLADLYGVSVDFIVGYKHSPFDVDEAEKKAENMTTDEMHKEIIKMLEYLKGRFDEVMPDIENIIQQNADE